MKSKSIDNLKNYSTILLFCFFFTVLFLGGVSEIFKQKNKDFSNLNNIQNPIRADILANLKTIKIKNNLGTYTLSKDDKTWFLLEPRLMPANSKRINTIINSLKNSSVKSELENEPINLSNFALENPSLRVDLFSELDEQLKIQIGLINPINDTSYITVSGVEKIYQMNVFHRSFQFVKISDLIDSSIFSMPLKDINEFKLYSRDFKDPINKLQKRNTNWKSKKYNSITKENVDKKIQSILNIKTYMIIDKKNEDLENLINNYLEKPLYKITIKTGQKKVKYKISSLTKSIPELKLEKRQYFLMTASDRKYTYVLQKDYLKDFYIRYSDLK